MLQLLLFERTLDLGALRLRRILQEALHQDARLVDELGAELVWYLPWILVKFDKEVVGKLLGFAALRLHVHVVEEDAFKIVIVLVIVVILVVVLLWLFVLVRVVKLIAVVVAVLSGTAAIFIFFLIFAAEAVRLKILLPIVRLPTGLVCLRSLRYLTL